VEKVAGIEIEPTLAGSGPWFQRNWIASEQGQPKRFSYEVELYSDAVFKGALERESALGPYSVLNLVPFPRPTFGDPLPALIARVDWHLDTPGEAANLMVAEMQRGFTTTDESRYHGGSPDEEIAALISLVSGRRVRAGQWVRRFDVSDSADPMGRPIAGYRPRPVVMAPPQNFGSVLPNALGEHSLQVPLYLRSFPSLPAGLAMSIVRAARLYQNALWIAEADPNSAWLLLVSAVEVAAGAASGREYKMRELMKLYYPDLSKTLETAGNGVFKAVAAEFGVLAKATQKFLDFIHENGPPAIEPRSGAHFETDWSRLNDICKEVYKRRSSALHSGLPFPRPMCEPPRILDGGRIAERPFGPWIGYPDSHWTIKDTYICLNTFEYIVRGTLLKWWDSISRNPTTTTGSPAPGDQSPTS